MKKLFACLAVFAASLALAGEMPAAAVKGEVLEVKDVESYTYLRLKTKDGETWAAVPKAKIKTGAKVSIENAMVMNNFQSKTLNKTFPSIIFGQLGGATGSEGAAAAPHPTAEASSGKPAINVLVPKATGPNARTVAEIVGKAGELKDKPVLLRGKVVKYNPEIMGKNWLHLRDGSGSEANGTNDILVTTTAASKVGDIVTVKGIVRTEKSFGAGYDYKVLIEDATLQAQ
jgi:Tfp pilus assembly protein FimT